MLAVTGATHSVLLLCITPAPLPPPHTPAPPPPPPHTLPRPRTPPPAQAKVFQLATDGGAPTGKVIKINHGDLGSKMLNNNVLWVGMDREWEVGTQVCVGGWGGGAGWAGGLWEGGGGWRGRVGGARRSLGESLEQGGMCVLVCA